MENTPALHTERLLLRRFTSDDVEAFYGIGSDEQVNTFLPFFPFRTMDEARSHLQNHFLKRYEDPWGFRYAVCLRSDNLPIGYVDIGGDDSYDLGYALNKEHWHKGIATEASRAVVEQLKTAGVPYVTATHDVNNPRSGDVMKQIGMTYRYSYEELWQPKNRLVTFRMYQLNLDGEDQRVYRKYWDMSQVHFVEENL